MECPEGLGPGDSIVVAHPQTGRDVEGVVPAGVGPGGTFDADVPGHGLEAVSVPPGVRSGQVSWFSSGQFGSFSSGFQRPRACLLDAHANVGAPHMVCLLPICTYI